MKGVYYTYLNDDHVLGMASTSDRIMVEIDDRIVSLSSEMTVMSKSISREILFELLENPVIVESFVYNESSEFRFLFDFTSDRTEVTSRDCKSLVETKKVLKSLFDE